VFYFDILFQRYGARKDKVLLIQLNDLKGKYWKAPKPKFLFTLSSDKLRKYGA